MALLSREQILESNDIETRDVEVPEWGGSVRIRMLSGRDRDAFEASTVETKGNKRVQNLENLRARLVALCVVDENGALLFSKKDVHHLGLKSAAALDRVFSACRELNGMTEADIEELSEGFEEDPNESSISD